MITIIQNFICNVPSRLDVVRINTPKLAMALNDYEFIVNFNDTTNFNEIQNIYQQNINKLTLYNNLKKDWALVTLSMLQEVTTPYVMYLCEDQAIDASKQDIANMLNEMSELDIQFTNLTKLPKYSNPSFTGYLECEYGYSYPAKLSPTGRLSSDCIVKVDFWKSCIEEFLLNKDSCPHQIPVPKLNLPNYFEGYFDHSIGIRRFGDMKCYIPKKIIFEEYDVIKQKWG
jgi:hypothetical protein